MAQQDKKTSELDDQADITSDDRLIVLDSPGGTPSLRSMSISNFGTKIKAFLGLAKSDVGLGNVDNTSDVNKPVSTAQQTAIDAVDDSALHLTGDEAAEGVKTWIGKQYYEDKQYRYKGLAVAGVYLGAFSVYGTTAAIFNDVSSKSTFIFQNDDLPTVSTPFYVKNDDTGELIKVVGDGGFTWSGCVRGEFGTSPAPVTIGDVFSLQATGDNALYMDNSYERVLVDCTGGVLEVVLPDPLNYALDDGDIFTIFDYAASLGNGNALIVRDPTNNNTVEVWDAGAMVTAQYDVNVGIYNFQTIKSLASDYATPAKYAVKVATTSALSVSSYSFPNLNLSSSLFSIEGVTLKAGDPVLVKDQATASQNGVYIYNTSTQLIRADDFQTSQNYVPGMQFYVAEGIINADSVFILTANDNIVLDTTSLTFRRSGGVQTVSSKTANYTVTAADDGVIISYTTLAAARTVTLPALSAVSEGFKVTVADGTSGTHASTNNITIQRAGSDVFVDGSTSKVINVAGGVMTFVKLNGLWDVLDSTVTVDTVTAQTIAGAKTFSSPVLLPAGAVGAPSIARSAGTNTGLYFPTSTTLALAANGVQAASFSSTAVSFPLTFTASRNFNLGAVNIGATLNMVDVGASATQSILDVTQANSIINLPTRSNWTNTPLIYYIRDPLGLLGGGTGITINASDDGVGTFNDINGADPVNGAWNDSGGASGVGPFGAAAILNTQFGMWAMWGARGDTGSGASGGWNIVYLGALGY